MAYVAEDGSILRDLEKTCAKPGVRTRVEAVATAGRAGLIDAE